MIRKKYLKEDIKQLRLEVNNLRNDVSDLRGNQKTEFITGKYGLGLGEATIKDILFALLKHLGLEIAELTQKEQAAFKLTPIKKKKAK